jgi:hypothetical protein
MACSGHDAISQPSERGKIHPESGSLTAQAVLLFAAVYAVATLAKLDVVHLPETPLPRSVVLAVPVLASAIVVAC